MNPAHIPLQRDMPARSVTALQAGGGRVMKYENRDLRERTREFAIRVIRLYSGLPKRTEAQVLGRQVLRSGTSVGANYPSP